MGASGDGGCKWELASGSKRRWQKKMRASRWEKATMVEVGASKQEWKKIRARILKGRRNSKEEKNNSLNTKLQTN